MKLAGCYLLSENPLVISVADSMVHTVMKILPTNLPATILVFHTWASETPKELFRMLRLTYRYPRARMVNMCNTHAEVKALRFLRRQARFCHHNLFCDESVLHPLPKNKTLDAIYISQLAPFKRVFLAGKVKSLFIVAANPPVTSEKLKEFGVPNAVGNQHYFNRKELNDTINEARCGLALSEVEGGMLASSEYMLCGLPLVTTPSRGGRDVWFTKDNHILCEATQEGVATAVEEVKNRPWDHQKIRDDAIAKCKEHRVNLAQTIVEFGGVPRFNPETMTGAWFTENFVQVFFMKDFFESWDGSRFQRPDLIGRLATQEEARVLTYPGK